MTCHLEPSYRRLTGKQATTSDSSRGDCKSSGAIFRIVRSTTGLSAGDTTRSERLGSTGIPYAGRRCTLFQIAGGSLRDAQAQLGHTKMSTTLEHYTIPIDENRRGVVEKLDVLVTNGDEFGLKGQDLRMPSRRI